MEETKVGHKKKIVAPKLRFREFSDKWNNILLDDLAVRGSGHTPSKSFPNYYNGDIKWVSLADSKKLDRGYIDDTEIKISLEGIKHSSAVLHPKESVLLSRDAGVGKSAVMKTEMAVSQHFIVWQGKKNILSNWFLYHIMQILKPEFERIAIGSTIKTIGLPYFKKLKIAIPNYTEQQKIAGFLSAVDEKIQLLTRKKQLLEQYKKGVMQQLFSGKLRFKDENGKAYPKWEEKNLGEICKITTGKLDANAMVENGKYRFYTCAKDYYLIDNYAFDTNALLISGNGANVGYIHHYIGKFNAYQRTYILDGFDDNIIYIKYFLEKNLYKRIFKEKKEGNTPYIVLGTLSEMQIALPSIEEQKKIADFLSAIDVKIESLSKQISQTKNFKKGLLQQMFV